MNTKLFHGSIGSGQAVHLISNQHPLCGSGTSSLGHTFRSGNNRIKDAGLKPLTCKKCIAKEKEIVNRAIERNGGNPNSRLAAELHSLFAAPPAVDFIVNEQAQVERIEFNRK